MEITAIAKTDDYKNDLSLSQVGDLFFDSKLFPDVKSAAQAKVKILAGREMGLSPFASMNGFHIIQGKVEASAALVANRIKSSGKYDYRVRIMSEEEVSIEFFERSQLTGQWESIGVSSFSQADAKRAGTGNMAKFPRNMLWARAMTNGQGWFCPDVFQIRVYGEEELSEISQLKPQFIQAELAEQDGKQEEDIIDNSQELSKIQSLIQEIKPLLESTESTKKTHKISAAIKKFENEFQELSKGSPERVQLAKEFFKKTRDELERPEESEPLPEPQAMFEYIQEHGTEAEISAARGAQTEDILIDIYKQVKNR